MNFRQPSMATSGGEDPSPPRKEVQLQGPRPAPLQVRKDSFKIKKPPLPKPPPPKPLPADTNLRPQPIIIYAVSPKIVYADVNDFMNVVQRLTGPSLTSDDLISAGDISPAARLASIESINSPSERNRDRHQNQNRETEVISLVGEGVEMSQIPGILSPAPASLSRMWAEFFSPANEQAHNNNTSNNNNNNNNNNGTHYYSSSSSSSSSVLNEFSPLLQGISFLSSPGSNLFSTTPIFSPTLSFDLFNFDSFW